MNRSQTPPAILPGRTVSEVLSGSRVSKPTIRPCVNAPRGGREKSSGLPRGLSVDRDSRRASLSAAVAKPESSEPCRRLSGFADDPCCRTWPAVIQQEAVDGSMRLRIQQGKAAHDLGQAQGQGAAEGQQEVAAPNAGRQGVTAARVRHPSCGLLLILAANP